MSVVRFRTMSDKIKAVINKIENARMMGRNEKIEKQEVEETELKADSLKYKEEKEKRFVEAVSLGWSEEHRKRFKAKMQAEPDFLKNSMKNYQKRNMLKCVSNGQLLPKNNFAVDFDFPLRGFRSIKAIINN